MLAPPSSTCIASSSDPGTAQGHNEKSGENKALDGSIEGLTSQPAPCPTDPPSNVHPKRGGTIRPLPLLLIKPGCP